MRPHEIVGNDLQPLSCLFDTCWSSENISNCVYFLKLGRASPRIFAESFASVFFWYSVPALAPTLDIHTNFIPSVHYLLLTSPHHHLYHRLSLSFNTYRKISINIEARIRGFSDLSNQSKNEIFIQMLAWRGLS
jgi:hypothetical protein